jgi:hypothetical protein
MHTKRKDADAHQEQGLGVLTNVELCRAFRTTQWALTNSTSVDQMMAVVAERQRYLDEFERRNAEGLAAWLGSDVGSLGHPLPFFLGSRGRCSAIKWDELTRRRAGETGP